MSITIPLKELSKFLAEFQQDSPGKYEVNFHLAEDGVIHDFFMVQNVREQRLEVRSVHSPVAELRARKAELTLRSIATACLKARTTKDYESAVSNIVEAHNAWVADKIPLGEPG
jgi:hypothetical protein